MFAGGLRRVTLLRLSRSFRTPTRSDRRKTSPTSAVRQRRTATSSQWSLLFTQVSAHTHTHTHTPTCTHVYIFCLQLSCQSSATPDTDLHSRFSVFLPLHRLQDSLEFIGQDGNTLRPDQNTGASGLLGNIGNTSHLPQAPLTVRKFSYLRNCIGNIFITMKHVIMVEIILS